jgi:2-keto-3-deoxy-6-phosphogluconate aldolase
MPALIAAGSLGQASMTFAKSALMGAAFVFSPSLVQALVQAAERVDVSPVVVILAIGVPPLDSLRPSGSPQLQPIQ